MSKCDSDLLESLFKNAKGPSSVKLNTSGELSARDTEEKRIEESSQKVEDSFLYVKSVDPLAKEILLTCRKSALYKFINGKWATTDVTGPSFVYERLDKPFHSLFIASKTSNFIRPIEESSKIEFKPPFIFLVFKQNESFGICFHDVAECPKFFETVTSVIKRKSVVQKAPIGFHQFLGQPQAPNEVTMTYSEKTTVTASFKSKNVINKIKTSNVRALIRSELVDMSNQNLKCIRMIDPLADRIVCQASHGALYNYNVETDEWIKSEVGGPFFVYRRKDRPFYSYMIANRQSLEDWIQPIKKEMRFECNCPYIFTNIPKSILLGHLREFETEEIKALWFGDEKECTKVYRTLVDLKQQLDQPDEIENSELSLSSTANSNASAAFLNTLFPTPVVKVERVTSPVVEEADVDEKFSEESEDDTDGSEEGVIIHEQYEELRDKGNLCKAKYDTTTQDGNSVINDRPITVHTAPKILEALFGALPKPSTSEEDTNIKDKALKYVRSVDKSAFNVEHVYKHVALYNFDIKEKNWTRTDIHGPLFLYSRACRPTYQLILASKENSNDFIIPLKGLTLAVQVPFIFGKSSDDRLMGFYFARENDCRDAFKAMEKLMDVKDEPNQEIGRPYEKVLTLFESMGIAKRANT